MIKENVILVSVLNKVQQQRWPLMAMFEHSFYRVNACIGRLAGSKLKTRCILTNICL